MDPLAILNSMTDGLHPSLTVEKGNSNGADLHQWIASTNRRSIFITDCRFVSETAWADQFSESLLIETPLQTTELSEDADGQQNDVENYQAEEYQTVEQESDVDAWMETGLAQFIGDALAELAERQNDEDGLPDLVWLHMSGLTSAWDAPYEYRLALCDEDDPRPSYAIEPISFGVDTKTDLDQVFQAMCAAAGQAKLIDHLWSWIDAFVEQLPERESMAIVLAGVRGYPLGEHSSVGLETDSKGLGSSAGFNTPHAELVHVPLIIQPGYMPLGYRVRRIAQPTSIRGFLKQWLADLPVFEPAESQPAELKPATESKAEESKSIPSKSIASSVDLNRFELLVDDSQASDSDWVQSSTYEAIYTTFWAAIFDPLSNQVVELYLMPDDRWQQNNVQNRVPEIVDAMSDLRMQWLQWKADSIAQATTILPQPTPANCLKQSV